ncbi:MAG: hypothetical protein C0475_08415 [Planctomyces sp.]|nr:hypothetical protein [Planctomyces sp.]MBA4120849.1 hypothetical protein [Isosphaera sp.]
MATRSTTNNILFGAFIIAGLAIFVMALITLGGLRNNLQSTRDFVVRFSLADGAEGLDAGSQVKVGGQRIGQVTGVSFFNEPGTSIVSAVDVRVSVDRSVTLYRNATPVLQQPLLGSSSTINISFVGDPRLLNLPAEDPGMIRDGDVVPGRLAPPSFLAQAGYGDEQADQVRVILRRMSDIAERLQRVSAVIDGSAEPIIDNAVTATDDVRQITSTLRQGAARWSPRVDSILAGADDATAQLLLRINEFEPVIRAARLTADLVQGRLDSILRNADELTQRVSTDLYDRVARTIGSAERSLAQVESLSINLNGAAAESRPVIRQTLANTRLAADQLKLSLIEIRRNPWRLLYQPSRKELEQELVFDAARAYSSAASDLRASTAALEGLLSDAANTGRPADPAQITQITDRINEHLQQVDSSQRAFLDRLLQRPPTQPPTRSGAAQAGSR